MEKFNPNTNWSCAKCGHNEVEMTYSKDVTAESKEHTKWDYPIGPESINVFCRRCSYDIGSYEPLNKDVK
jgi:hypothetical protein